MNLGMKFRRTASTTLSLGSLQADATRPRRLEWYYVSLGSEAAAADNPFLYILQRFTAPGTFTAITLQPLDPADAATESDAGENHTVDATYTANLILAEWPLNQRATFQWHAPEKGRFITPATANNGLGISTPTSSAVAITGTLHANEL
jgi:hypothetical protein